MLQWKFRHLTLVNNFSIFTVKKIKETDKNQEIKMSVLRSSEKISNLSDKNVSQVASFEFLGIYTKKKI